MLQLRLTVAVLLVQVFTGTRAYDGSSSSSTRRRKMFVESTVYYHGVSLVYFDTVVNATSLQLLQCQVYANRKIASHKVRDSMIASSLTEQQYKIKIAECENVTSPGFKASLRSSRLHPQVSINYRKVLGNHLYSTYPGTKWCGTGILASTASDLGALRSVDKCCRDHARCFDSLQPGEVRHGLENRDFYGRKHCRCDHRLYRCLKQLAPNEDADLVGHMYFNVLQIECFEEDLPKVCTGYDDDGLCSDYDYPGGVAFVPRYQWFTNPPFKKERLLPRPV